MRDAHAVAHGRAVQRRQRVAVDVLHHEVGDVVLLSDVEDLGDVRVLDARRDVGLVEEHALEALVVGEPREDGLDGDQLLEPVLARLAGHPHLGHPALRDGAEQLVAIQLEARCECRAVRLHRHIVPPPRWGLRGGDRDRLLFGGGCYA